MLPPNPFLSTVSWETDEFCVTFLREWICESRKIIEHWDIITSLRQNSSLRNISFKIGPYSPSSGDADIYKKLLIFLTCTLGRSSLSWHLSLAINLWHFLSLDRTYQNIFTSLQQRSLTLVVDHPCSSMWTGSVVYCLHHLSSSGYLYASSVYLYTEILTWGMSYIVSYPW